MAEEIQLTPEQQALYNQAAPAAAVEINPLRDFDANQLAELAVKDKENFDLVGEFRRNQDMWADPAHVQKAADALDIVKQRGFELSDLPGPAKIGKTVLESAKGFGKQLWNYASAAVGMAQGAIAEPFSTELATGFADEVTRKLSSNIAGTEEAMTGLAQIPEKAVAKIGRIVGGPKTPEQKIADLWKDVGRSEVQQQRVTGQGPLTQAVTGGAAGELPAEEISTLAAGDPFSFATFSKGFQLAGRAIPGAVRGVAAKVGEKSGDVTAAAAGRTVQASGALTEMGAKAVGAVAPITGAVAGGAKGAALGGIPGAIAGTGIGAAGGRTIARGAKQISTAGAKVADIGKQVAGAKPVISPLAQAGRDVLQAAPGASGTVAIGLGQDIGLSALTSETPAETESAIGIGTALGAASALGRVGRRVISGQLVAPREYGVNTITPSSGNFPTLDAVHSDSIRNATPGEQTRLNAVRLFAKGAAPGTDIFFAKDRTALVDALTRSGMSSDTAGRFADNEGFFTATLPDKNGVPRPVIIARNVEAAPHEAFHAVQDVLGEAANREVDNIIKAEYADQWEQFGQRYASRLAEPQGKAVLDWRETILDETGSGSVEAVEKLSQTIANELTGQTGADAPADFVQQRVRAEWSRLMDEARQRNPQGRPEQVWRDVLSPEEATAVADRYIARELAAENFDIVFKNLGASLDAEKPGIRKLARIAANLISTLGGEPLAGRRSEIGQIEPRFGVTKAVTKAPVTTVGPRSAPRTVAPTTPRTVAESPANEARTIAAEAPDTIQAGGTRSPRELLGEMAEAIAQRSGVKINYLSAPGEPAAATTSNRAARREIIEAFRTMPAEARSLWEKSFFPERVLKTKNGFQIMGWAPEVFAANAHKLAGWLADHPGVASPYAVDTATKSFTPDAWRQLFSDTQQYVINQQAGATGAGGELVVPASVLERGFTAPVRTGGETGLAQANADVISMLFGIKLPETPRITKGRLPRALAAEDVSAATLPGRVSEPARPRGEFSGAEAEAQGIAGREIREVNPFRQQVEAAGNPPSLIEAIQRLNLENIKEVALAPEHPQFRANEFVVAAGFQPNADPRAIKEAAVRDMKTGKIYAGSWHGEAFEKAEADIGRKIQTAYEFDEGFVTNSGEFLGRVEAMERGIEMNQLPKEIRDDNIYLEATRFEKMRQFQPVAETAKRLVAMSPEEWKSTVSEYKGKLGGGLTGWAFDLGASAKDAADVTALREAATQLQEASREAMRASMQSAEPEVAMNRAMELVGRSQAAREAFEAATGSNLEGTNQGSSVPFIRKHIDADYVPPVPGELKIAAQPKTEGSEIRDIAEKYSQSTGIDYSPSKPVSSVNQNLAERIADFYDGAQHSPDSAKVKQSYDALASETIDQLRAIQEAGYVIEPWNGEGEPYKSSAEMVSDVRNNKHLFFLPTESSFDDAGGNLMLQDSGTEFGSVNNVFRAVHDFFGHAKEGYQFGPKGEFNAWRAHSDMYSPDAQGALASETLAQNSWVNFSEQVRGKNIPLKDRPFAEQKNIVVPEELIAEAKGQFQPAKQRNKGLRFPKASSSGFKKAWVLPSGEPVQLGGTWHHEWLADNPEVAKQYKLSVPKFEGTDVDAVREDALRAGFTRINYGVNNGQLTVEARAKDWRRVKNTVEDMISTNLDDIDRVSVTLFDDAVKEVVDSDSSSLFNMDTDQEKLAALPFITKGEIRGQFQPKKQPRKKIQEFWLSPSGKIIQAPDGHTEEAFKIFPNLVPEGHTSEALYEAMFSRKYLRGVQDTATGRLYVDGVKEVFTDLSREQRAAIEDLAFENDVPVSYNNKALDVGPKAQFQPAREETGTLFDLPEPKSFPEAVKPKRGQTDISSDIADSPLAKQAGSREDAISLFADKLKQEAAQQETNPAFQIGKRWYSEFTPELKREFGDDAPLMAELLAATSPQTNVETNFGYAIDVLNNWKAGKYDKLVAKLDEGYRRLEDGSLAKIYRRDVREGKVENPPENPSDATYVAWWMLKHDLLPRGTSGRQVGLHSKNVAKVLTRRWLSETRGPKTKNFVQNLLGTGDEATIDIWADRLLRRIGYEGFAEKWRILPENVKGVSDADFEFGQAAFRQAAKDLNLKPSDLQAALWFTEKQRWADNGWSDKLDLGDFRTEIKRTEEYRRGFAEGRGPSEVRQGAKPKQPVPEFEQMPLEIKPRRVKVK